MALGTFVNVSEWVRGPGVSCVLEFGDTVASVSVSLLRWTSSSNQ